MTSQPLEVIGPYRVLRPIGSGGMGDVYLAQPASGEGEEVAVKVLRPELCADPDFRRRFGREVEAARRVHGRAIARVLGADLDAPQPWIATEYVPGPTLRENTREVDLHALAAGLARALADIHAAGVVHRDLTPANVILGPTGPRVVDFGIAWFGDATTLTRTGTVIGTPAWMAPEQLGEDRTTPASDIWAWGAVMAYAATGRPPVTGSRPEVIQVRAARGELDLDGVPDWLLPHVRRAMDPDPSRRPTAAKLAAELGVPTDSELTQVLERTWVHWAVVEPTVAAAAPTSLSPEAATGASLAGGPEGSVPVADAPEPLSTLPRWVTRSVLGAVVGVVGARFASVAAVFGVVLLVSAIVVLAAGIRIWEVERQPKVPGPWAPSPLSLFVAALVTVGVALVQPLGVLAGLVALVAIAIFLVAIGAHGH